MIPKVKLGAVLEVCHKECLSVLDIATTSLRGCRMICYSAKSRQAEQSTRVRSIENDNDRSVPIVPRRHAMLGGDSGRMCMRQTLRPHAVST